MLILRGFTEKGAERAVAVYSANSEFARLDELEIEPEAPEGGRRSPGFRRRGGAAVRERQREKRPNGLSLPLGKGRAFIPSGITETDFDLLMETLRIWKPRLVRAGKPARGCG